jgi:hypothetical protein
MSNPPKWTQVYSHGTKEGDEEMSFFIALARNPKWTWLSTAQISKESNLSQKRVEEIISKYLKHKPPLIIASTVKEDHWAYWERVPDMIKTPVSLANKDQEARIDKYLIDPFTSQVIVV